MSKKVALFLVTLSALFWGANFNAGKIVIEHLSPMMAAAIRFSFASIIIVPILLLFETNIKETIQRNFFIYIVMGVVGIAAFNALFFLGLKYTTPINGALITATNPLSTILLARLILKDPIRFNQKIGMLFSLLGVIVVITNGSLGMLLQLKVSIGDWMILAGSICWSFYSVFGRRYLKESKPLITTTATMVIGSIVLIILALNDGSFEQALNQSWTVYVAIAYMAVFGSVLAYLFWNYGIEHLGAANTSIFFNLVPVFTVLISLINGHSIEVMQMVGGVLVIFGVMLSTNAIKLLMGKKILADFTLMNHDLTDVIAQERLPGAPAATLGGTDIVLPVNDPVLDLIIAELATVHQCHTIILYGSRARGDYTSTSDYDVAGISKEGKKQRIARFDQNNNVYLDIFIYPENEFTALKNEHLNMADGIVIVDSNEFGKTLISQLKAKMNEPEQISSDEIQARKVWYNKMLSRASRRDLEGKYRHIWSIFAILEDYFIFRGMRYQGPKKAFQYIEMHDQESLALFNEALSNTNDLDALARLIGKVVN